MKLTGFTLLKKVEVWVGSNSDSIFTLDNNKK